MKQLDLERLRIRRLLRIQRALRRAAGYRVLSHARITDRVRVTLHLSAGQIDRLRAAAEESLLSLPRYLVACGLRTAAELEGDES